MRCAWIREIDKGEHGKRRRFVDQQTTEREHHELRRIVADVDDEGFRADALLM
jgi:hypothetical protein